MKLIKPTLIGKFFSAFLHKQLFLIFVFITLLINVHPVFSAPPAGTTIGNQASATYTDSSQVERTVTSNTVVTVVQQIASLTLSANGAKSAAAGGQVTYPHTIVNTGNGPDSFALTSSNTGGFSFSSVAFYADTNGDGVPDNSTAITNTGSIPADGVFKFVVVGLIPGGASTTSTNTLTVSAASVLTPATTASNTDTTTISSNAVITVTKALDITAGASPSLGRTITLTYTNTGNSTASAVTLLDMLPSGMTYVAGSARWSVTGSTVLTDANNADNQSGITYDFGITQAGRVTAIVSSVGAGVSGTLTFQVNIPGGLSAGANSTTANTAQFSYNDGVTVITATNTNTVQYTVTQGAGLTLTGSTVASAPQGGTVTFSHVLTNTGNSTDSFDLTIGNSTFPAGTSFVLYQADGVTPLLDSNGNSIPDSGPLAGGANTTIILKATLPAGATGGPYTTQLTGTAKSDTTKTATATDTLTAITSNTVDITANSAGVAAPGVGAGPEANAVVTNSANPGATTRFTLYVANSSGVADSYNLQASTDGTFSSQTLPTGWSVVFKDANNAIITNTGVVNAGANKQIFADVTIPSSGGASSTDIFFRALSPTSGASDRIHNAITVAGVRGFSIAPNNTGQIFPGGSVVYSHTITNTGNVLEGDGTITQAVITLTNTSPGFSAVAYWDKNNNGVLDTTDPVITNLSQLTGGSNGASTAAGLSPAEEATLLVKVFAPTNAAVGAIDTTTLIVTATGPVSGVAAPSPATATDSSSVITGQLSLNKVHALDANCDGTADTAFSTSNITAGAIPGACIRYQITGVNVGISNITTVVISDATPPSTTYQSAAAAATTVGTITAPGNGAAGTIQANVGTLTPGQSVVVTFGVRINP